jgi:uncharacterized radical SAM superfamily Fe-S cluster-containing enzyme
MDCEFSGMRAETESLCPHCLKKIPAAYEACGDEVFIVKSCPAHGEFRTISWRGEPKFNGWKRPKTGTRSGECHTETSLGCPFDCGLCPDHRKNACTAVIEVTSRCNLSCPVCFADSVEGPGPDPDLDTIAGWYLSVLQTSGPDIILQLSGGEPTVRGDLPCIVEMGRAKGFSFIQLNTNGLRLAAEKNYAKELRAAGLSSVFLQFDGTEDKIYRAIRGQSLYMAKREAIEQCAENDIGVVLVPTLVPGVNTHNIGAILDLALELSPVVRGCISSRKLFWPLPAGSGKQSPLHPSRCNAGYRRANWGANEEAALHPAWLGKLPLLLPRQFYTLAGRRAAGAFRTVSGRLLRRGACGNVYSKAVVGAGRAEIYEWPR